MQRHELLRLLTAGSVDDGKSTLIGRLLYDTKLVYDDQLAAVAKDSRRKGGDAIDLSLLVDGLKAEREQGITIDVAYRYFATAKRKFIIADCPGHEQYTRNMATGASNCDLAIILIDARQGVMVQTRRHSFIVSLLGIRHVVVAINKMDLVGYSQQVFEAIRDDYATFATRLEVGDVRFIPMSALEGDNVVVPSTSMPWYSGETLLHFLESVHIASDRNLIDFRFPVQYVNRPNQDFRGYAGTIGSGVVRRGDEIVVLPSGQRSHIESIVVGEDPADEAFAPQAVTVTLTDNVDVSRGNMLAHPANVPRIGQECDAMVVWMGEDPLSPDKHYWVKHTTNVLPAQVASIRYRLNVNTLHREETTTLAMNEVGRCRVVVSRPIAFDAYSRNRATGAFVIIDRLTNNTVGAGMILDRVTLGDARDEDWGAEPMPAVVPTQVTLEERQQRLGQRPVTLLLTGLSRTGKTTLAYALERRLFEAGKSVIVLDGRRMRHTISGDLGFSFGERVENLRRSINVARIVNDAGLICICAFMAPSADVRDKARAALGDRFLEVHLTAPLDVCRARDDEGVYAKADSGEIPAFPGVTAPYEAPSAPDLVLDTAQLSVEESVDRLITLLSQRGAIA